MKIKGLFPEIPPGTTFKVINYVAGNRMLPATKGMTLADFGTVSYFCQSGAYHHFISDGSRFIVCALVFVEKSPKNVSFKTIEV